jgi:hypothetical protein
LRSSSVSSPSSLRANSSSPVNSEAAVVPVPMDGWALAAAHPSSNAQRCVPSRDHQHLNNSHTCEKRVECRLQPIPGSQASADDQTPVAMDLMEFPAGPDRWPHWRLRFCAAGPWLSYPHPPKDPPEQKLVASLSELMEGSHRLPLRQCALRHLGPQGGPLQPSWLPAPAGSLRPDGRQRLQLPGLCPRRAGGRARGGAAG